MPDLPRPGLRERKRHETRRRIEAAAAEIVDTDGLEALTIEAISERADVSPRTFFNYFDSKEDAITGLRPEDDTRQTIDEVLRDLPAGPLVERVIDLLLGVTDGPGLDVELRARRRRIIQAHPDLMQRHFLHMGKMLGPLTEAVSTLLQRAGGTDAEADGDTRAQAEVMLMMCGAALRAQSLEFARAGADLTSDDVRARLRTRAADLIRHTMEGAR